MSRTRLLLAVALVLTALVLLLLPLTTAAAPQALPAGPSDRSQSAAGPDRPPLHSMREQTPFVLRLVSAHGKPAHVAARVSEGERAEAATASFSIDYLPGGAGDGQGATCEDWDTNAQAAFSASADTWATLIRSTVPIRIRACWANLGGGSTLGYAWSYVARDFPNAPVAGTWYSYALADALAGYDLDATNPDIFITYNTAFAWYFGTDGSTPTDQVDFMSVVMHEIAHGLNFAGSMKVSGAQGSWGYGATPAYPNIYDRFVQNGSGDGLINTALFANPSDVLAAQLTGNDLFFTGPNARSANGSASAKIYAPDPWAPGSSYSHLDYSTFNNTANRMMVYAISNGEWVHDPGPVGINLLKDVGWPTNQAPTAVADQYEVTAGAVLAGTSVLANDLAGDGPEPLSAEPRSDPAHGTLAFNSDGTFSYTPAQGYSGGDSFTYRNYNGAFYSADARVDITVNGEVTAPVTTITLDPAAPNGEDGWYTSAVKVTVAATDEAGGSGVAETRCVLDPATAPATFDDLPAGCAYTGAGAAVTMVGQHTLYAASKDNAGNKESIRSATFKIASLVSIVTPVDHAVYPLGLTVAAAYSCDAIVGVAACSGPVASGAALDTATAGDETFTVQMTDTAGKITSVTVHYRVLSATPGPVVAWGNNNSGETDVPAGLQATAVDGGGAFSLALKSDGTVVAWGDNYYGQLDVPTELSDVVAIATAYAHNLALKRDGTVVAWGWDEYGQLDVPPGLSGVTAIAGRGLSLALKSDGTVVAWGENSDGQATVPPGLSGVTAIAGGCYHSLALKNDGTVVAWGSNSDGQRTVPPGLSGVTAISGGCFHNLALKSNGEVVAWGNNDAGQTTVPASAKSGVVAIAAGGWFSMALKSDGTIVAWGNNEYDQSTPPPGLGNVTAFGAGWTHAVAVGQFPQNIVVDPTSLSATQQTGLSAQKTLDITDSGDAALTWTITAEEGAGAACDGSAGAPAWASVAPASGTTAPGATSPVVITFDAAELAAGSSYEATLCISSNDPTPGPGNGTALVKVPLTFTVTAPAPRITVDPTSLNAAVGRGATSQQTLTIGNAGAADLLWEIPTAGHTAAAAAARPLEATSTGYALDITNSPWDSGEPHLLSTFPLSDFNARTSVGYAAARVYAMDFDAAATTLYGLDFNTHALGRFDLTTGAFTTYATSMPADGYWWMGMAIDPRTNEAYAVSADCGANRSNLYRIDLTTGEPTLVGDMSLPCVVDIAISPDGAMYAHDVYEDSIYRIDRATAEATSIGPTGYNADYMQGMDFDNEDGTLYIALFDPWNWETHFGTVDLATGHVTELSSNSNEYVIAIRNTATCEPSDAAWLSAAPLSGTAAPGGSSPVQVTMDSAGLAVGTYNAHLCVNSNDPAHGQRRVEANLVVNPLVNVDVSPLSLVSTQHSGATSEQTLNIANTDVDNLTWTLTAERGAGAACNGTVGAPAWLSAAPAAGTNTGTGSTPVAVSFDATGLVKGTYEATLCITSNDPTPGPGNGTKLVKVPVTLTVDAQAGMTVAPTTLAATFNQGENSQQTVTIGNSGDADLVWEIPTAGYAGSPGAANSPAASSTGYLFGWLSQGLSSFPVTDFDAQTHIGYASASLFAMDFDATATTLYGLDYNTNAFGRFDLNTGEFTTIATSTPRSGNWTGMAIDPQTNEAYASSGYEGCGTSSLLYQIDLTTGAPTYIGDMNLPCVIDIAISPTGAMYAHDVQTDSIYRIDRNSAQATLVGPTGYNATWAQGMDFDNESGELYIALFGWPGPLGDGTYYGTVDLTDGHVTVLTYDGDRGTNGFQCTIAIANRATCENNAAWLTVDPASGTTTPTGSSPVQVTMNSAGLAQGTYNAEVCISSNDPVHGQTRVPVTMVLNPMPVTTITLDPAAPNGPNGWYTSAVQVTVAADEPGGSVAETRCVLDPGSPPASFDDIPAGCAYTGAGASVSAVGEHTLYAASVDNAGNKAGVRSAAFKIALQLSIVTPVDHAVYPQGLTVTAAYSCDAVSGVVACSGPVAAGAALDTATAGDKTFTVQTTDQAGNTASATVAYRVLPATPGPVAAWGWNGYGQTNVPAGLSDATAVDGSTYDSVALKSDGTVVAWGQPSLPAGLTDVKAVAVGMMHSLTLNGDGTVQAWGYNGDGETNVPDAAKSGVIAVAAGEKHSMALRSDGTVVAWGLNDNGQATVPPGLSGVTAISAGAFHSLALKSNGEVVAWGNNNEGETDVPDAAKGGVTAIAAGFGHSLALKSDHTVVAWGWNDAGQATVPPGLSGVTAIAAGESHSLALKSDHTVVAWGAFWAGQNTVPAGLHGVIAIAAGYNHNLAILEQAAAPVTTIALDPAAPDGQAGWYTSAVQVTVTAADANVGSGVAETRCVLDPATAPATFDDLPPSCAYTGAGAAVTAVGEHTFYAASKDYAGNHESVSSATFKIASRITIVTPVNHAVYPLGLTVSAAFSCETALGATCSGTVADGAPLDTATAGDKTFTVQVSDAAGNSISLSVNYRVLPAEAGPVVAWGDNSYDQITMPPALSDVTAVAGGGWHSLALKSDGTVVAWGSNAFNQLDVPAEALSGVAAIAANYHNLALKSDGSVVAWGWNSAGQSTVPAEAQSGIVAVAAGGEFSLALKADGTVVGWGEDSWHQATPPVGLSGVTAIAAGRSHGLALKSDGTVAAWGSDEVGEKSVPPGLTGVTAIAAGYLHSLALKSDHTVVAWGWNNCGQAGVPAGLTDVVAIAAGYGHSLALKSDGTIVAWGGCLYGAGTAPAGLRQVTGISAGDNHNLVVLRPDAVQPVTRISLDPALPDGDNGWYTSAVLVTVAATDDASGTGVAETRCVLDPLTPPAAFDDIPAGCAYTGAGASVSADGEHAIYSASKDYAGNAEAVSSASLKIDSSTPAIGAWATLQDGSPYGGTWANQDVIVHFYCSNPGPSGVGDCTGDITLSTDGETPFVIGTVTNVAGTTASTTYGPIKVDKTPPVVTGSRTPAANANVWNNTTVVVSWACDPGPSGQVAISPDETFTVEAAGQTATGSCTDGAGNTGAGTLTVNIDETKPVVTIAGIANGDRYIVDSVPTATCPTTDALSDVETQAVPTVTGAEPDGTGTLTLTCSGGTDKAGNVADPIGLTYFVKLPDQSFNLTVDPNCTDVDPPDGVCDGTLDMFTTIQKAVDVSTDGDIQTVLPGTYNENLVIDKPLDLVGPEATGAAAAGTKATVAAIDAGGAVLTGLITVNSSHVAINGFTLTNPGGANVVVITDATPSYSDVSIVNNAITDVGGATFDGPVYAIRLYGADGVTIGHNTIDTVRSATGRAVAVAVLTSAGDDPTQNLSIDANTISGITGGGTDSSAGVWLNNTAGVTGLAGHGVSNTTFATISGGASPSGVNVAAPVSGCGVDACTFTEVPTGLYQDLGGSGAKIENSLFLTGVAWGVATATSAPVTATNDYWRTACGANLGGAAAPAAPLAVTEPWWALPTGGSTSGNPSDGYNAPAGNRAGVQAILDCADLVNLAGGAYDGTLTAHRTTQTIRLTGETSGSAGPVFTIDGVDITLAGVDTTPSGPAALRGHGTEPGVLVDAGADNFMLQNVQVTNASNGVEVAGPVVSFKVVGNYIHDNSGDGLLLDAGDVAGLATIEGNLFKANGGLGIHNLSASVTLPAPYNSWGSVNGPAEAGGGDGISAGVDAEPFTFAEVYVDADPTTLGDQYVRDVIETVPFDVVVNAEAKNLYGVTFKVSYPDTYLTLNTVTLLPPFDEAGVGCSLSSGTGYVGYTCYMVTPWDGGPIATLTFTPTGAGLTGNGKWEIDLDVERAATTAGTLSGARVYMNNVYGLPSEADRDIADTHDGHLTITGIGQFKGFIDVQGRADDSGAVVKVYDRAAVADAVQLATATSGKSGAYKTGYLDLLEPLTIASQYWLYVDRPLYVRTRVVGGVYGPAQWLSRRPETQLAQLTLMGGDANNNEAVDLLDASCIGGSYGLVPSTCSGAGSADVNSDGKVDILDLTLMGGNYGITESTWTP